MINTTGWDVSRAGPSTVAGGPFGQHRPTTTTISTIVIKAGDTTRLTLAVLKVKKFSDSFFCKLINQPEVYIGTEATYTRSNKHWFFRALIMCKLEWMKWNHRF